MCRPVSVHRAGRYPLTSRSTLLSLPLRPSFLRNGLSRLILRAYFETYSSVSYFLSALLCCSLTPDSLSCTRPLFGRLTRQRCGQSRTSTSYPHILQAPHVDDIVEAVHRQDGPSFKRRELDMVRVGGGHGCLPRSITVNIFWKPEGSQDR